jgi:hypothetical protein
LVFDRGTGIDIAACEAISTRATRQITGSTPSKGGYHVCRKGRTIRPQAFRDCGGGGICSLRPECACRLRPRAPFSRRMRFLVVARQHAA